MAVFGGSLFLIALGILVHGVILRPTEPPEPELHASSAPVAIVTPHTWTERPSQPTPPVQPRRDHSPAALPQGAPTVAIAEPTHVTTEIDTSPAPATVTPIAMVTEPIRESEPLRPAKPWTVRPGPAPVHAPAAADHRVLRGTFWVASTMPGLPRIQADYVIPLGPDGSPMSQAGDMVAVFPYPTELVSVDGPAAVLASRWGFTLLGLRFPGQDQIDGDDRTRFYYYPESGSGAAWMAAIRRLREN